MGNGLKKSRSRVILALMIILLLSLFSSSAFAQTPRDGGVPIENLPEDLKSLDIKDYFLPSASKEAGVIHGLSGTVVVVHMADNSAYFGREGDTIYEKDAINTLPDSRCRLRFTGEDVVTMSGDSRFTVDSYEANIDKGSKASLFGMVKGKAMFYALRLFRIRDTRFELKTPTAVIGIRGTKFGAEVVWKDGDQARGEGVLVADNSSEPFIHLAQAGPLDTGNSYTNCFTEDGTLDVNGQVVAPGEMFRGDLGAVVPTPPEFVRAFEAETKVVKEGPKTGPAVEGGEGEGGGTKKETGPAKEEKAAEKTTGETTQEEEAVAPVSQETFVAASEKTSEVTQQEVAEETSASEGIAAGKIGELKSGFATIITDSQGMAFPHSIYRQKGDFEENSDGVKTHTGHALNQDNNNYKIVLQEQGVEDRGIKVTNFDNGTGSNIALSTPDYFKRSQLGQYYDSNGLEYLKWGTWESPSGNSASMKIGDSDGTIYYVAGGKIWWVEGYQTHADYIAYLQSQNQTYSYSGEVKGAFSRTDIDFTKIMTGTVSFNANFGDLSISNFKMLATGDNEARVDITSGSGTIKSDGDIDFTNLVGTMDDDKGAATDIDSTSDIGGGFGGPKAEGAGLDFGITDGQYRRMAGEGHLQR